MISIIIPTYNEAENIGKLIDYLKQNSDNLLKEIVVSDGCSDDETIKIATSRGATVVVSSTKGRAAQMNYGASFATGDVFYFIHADTLPSASFCKDILLALNEGYLFGRYRTKFSSKKWMLQFNAFFTRFDFSVCYGGDQTLFITRQLFYSLGGFKSDMSIMEDYEIVMRAKSKGRYKIIQKDALVSARKYNTNSWFMVQRANYIIVRMYKKGASQEAMVRRYKEMLLYR